jgi:glutathione reductase (NADPH)
VHSSCGQYLEYFRSNSYWNNNCILGTHILGPHAEEIINIFALAIRLGLNVDKIKEAISTYPKNSYDIKYML